ncbi:MAG: hypothetical protein TU35_006240 [Thermoproteus sp. AZ2]|uniref:Uncharacterized protein n=1 Tax=Thermoproteus sp. AZ2 TaxID=1609232 RepID=A0ACC6V183_9CREN|nr:MAG: hypothetical protein TU35_06680 [Thermoproteus sp. AZ2]
MAKITFICGEVSRHPALSPSHGFGVVINDVLAFDACSREAAEEFVKAFGIRPILGLASMNNPHHIGGFSAFGAPVVLWTDGVLALRIRGVVYRALGLGREAVLLVGRTVVSPCGMYTVPFGALSAAGVKADCFVGGLGGSTASPYSVARIMGELKAIGVRCVAPIHTAPGIIKELERKFNVYRPGAGSTMEVP